MRESVRMVQERLNLALTSWLQRNWYASSPSSLPRSAGCLLSWGAALYAAGLYHDQRRAVHRRRELPAFVISVGNLVVGGAGKTPLCLWLARYLHSLGWKPAILSRGYRRHHADTARVPSGGASALAAAAFGDEAVLLAHRARPVPVWVSKDRWHAGKLAMETDAANLLILDDGFQHLALKRNLDLVLLDARTPLGNGVLLPLGPLREPPAHLERADAIVLTRADDPKATAQTRRMIIGRFPEKPVFSCTHRLTGLQVGFGDQQRQLPLEALRGEKTVAFAGIARPETFFHLLQEAGIIVSRAFPFPDHHPYQDADLRMLLEATAECAASFLITTEKDLVRLPPQSQTFTLATLLELDLGADLEPFCAFLQARLHRSAVNTRF